MNLIPVDPGDNPFEEALVGGLGDGFNGKLHLLLRLGFGHIISSDLDPRFAERLDRVVRVDAEANACLARERFRANVLTFGLSAWIQSRALFIFSPDRRGPSS